MNLHLTLKLNSITEFRADTLLQIEKEIPVSDWSQYFCKLEAFINASNKLNINYIVGKRVVFVQIKWLFFVLFLVRIWPKNWFTNHPIKLSISKSTKDHNKKSQPLIWLDWLLLTVINWLNIFIHQYPIQIPLPLHQHRVIWRLMKQSYHLEH